MAAAVLALFGDQVLFRYLYLLALGVAERLKISSRSRKGGGMV